MDLADLMDVFLISFAMLNLVFTLLILRQREAYYPDDMLVDEQIESTVGSLL
ncbi:MAG: hypothetical protein R3F51_24435 [Cyanobacteriota/Melainabacteria group bacterium]